MVYGPSMFSKLTRYPLFKALLAVVTVLILFTGCAEKTSLQRGMNPGEVSKILGKPEKIAYQDGKLLTIVTDADKIDYTQYRVIYMYDNNTVQIWFQNGTVDSMTKNGIAVQLPDQTAH